MKPALLNTACMPPIWCAKISLSSVGMIAPAICVRLDASALPAAFGIQLRARAASFTRSLIASETLSGSLNTRDTVAVETFAALATASSLTRPLPSRVRFVPVTVQAHPGNAVSNDEPTPKLYRFAKKITGPYTGVEITSFSAGSSLA